MAGERGKEAFSDGLSRPVGRPQHSVGTITCDETRKARTASFHCPGFRVTYASWPTESNRTNVFGPDAASNTRRPSAKVALGSSDPCMKRAGQVNARAQSTGLWRNPLNPCMAPPQKTSSSALGNDGTCIAWNRLRTVLSMVSNTASSTTASAVTPCLSKARRIAAAPILWPKSTRPEQGRLFLAYRTQAATSSASSTPIVVVDPEDPPEPRKSTSRTDVPSSMNAFASGINRVLSVA